MVHYFQVLPSHLHTSGDHLVQNLRRRRFLLLLLFASICFLVRVELVQLLDDLQGAFPDFLQTVDIIPVDLTSCVCKVVNKVDLQVGDLLTELGWKRL